MAVNKIFEFGKDAAAYVLSDGDYLLDGERVIGNQPGIARADFVNKAIRQSAYMAAIVAQFIVDYASETVQDSDSNALGVTNLATAISNISGFPAGTNMVFYQAAAPTGWTQVKTYTDMALRVVSTAGGGIGGTHNLSSPPSTAHTHTGPLHSHTGGAHTHSISIPVNGFTDVGGGFNAIAIVVSPHQTELVAQSAPSATSGSSGTGSTSEAGTGNTGSTTPTAFAPKYIDVIVATKD